MYVCRYTYLWQVAAPKAEEAVLLGDGHQAAQNVTLGGCLRDLATVATAAHLHEDLDAVQRRGKGLANGARGGAG